MLQLFIALNRAIKIKPFTQGGYFNRQKHEKIYTSFYSQQVQLISSEQKNLQVRALHLLQQFNTQIAMVHCKN